MANEIVNFSISGKEVASHANVTRVTGLRTSAWEAKKEDNLLRYNQISVPLDFLPGICGWLDGFHFGHSTFFRVSENV